MADPESCRSWITAALACKSRRRSWITATLACESRRCWITLAPEPSSSRTSAAVDGVGPHARLTHAMN